MSPEGSASTSRLARLTACAPALFVIAPALLLVVGATSRASWASLGRDQGIFQYVAWAVDRGELAYRDVRDVNGPVITMVHLFFLALGGGEEHRFRVLDLFVTGLTFALAGATIPSLSSRGARLYVRIAWALAAWVVLSAQYVVYGFWETAQRESFLDWFVLVSIALQATRSASESLRSRRTIATIFASGAASFVPWLGKPTFALFTMAQIAAILLESEPIRARARRLAVFAAGGIAGLTVPLAFVALRGDLASWARITFVDVPTMYRFIWPRPAAAILSLPGYHRTALLAVATSTGLALFVVLGRLPRRAIPIAAMPVLGLASVLVQAKGFPYHFHPVTLGVAFGWLVALAATWDSVATASGRLIVLVVALMISGRAALLARAAPYPPEPPAGERDKASLESAERLAWFERVDYFPRALRDAAAYVDAHTTRDDRVQLYAMDPYLLFLAERKSATPYVYAYDLNADAALAGAYDPGGPHPTPEEASRIRAMRDEHAHDLLARLERAPPAAFVFVDRSPLMSYADSVIDFSVHCPEAFAWLQSRYRETAEFEGIRIWLRDDVVTSSD
jgi:hypothetical protein